MRAGYLDALRALAILMMIIFHTAYDMRVLGMIHWNFSVGFWYAFPRVIAFTFLFCVGASLNFVHTPQINWPKLLERSYKLGLAALIISLATYLLYPTQWVYFGTLHCIFLGSILGAILAKYRKLSFLLMLLILYLQYICGYGIKWVSSYLQKPSMDFIPIYPWFWVILLGILLGPLLSKNRHLREIKVPKMGQYLSNHSLKIYLFHQPLIYLVLWIISSLI